MKIIFTRHGECLANILREISDTGLKHPLTRTGRQQANDLAVRLAPYGVTRIFTSPLLRAIETSVIVANALDLDYEVADALREIYRGILEGRSDEVTWKMMEEISADWVVHQRWERRIEGGESFYDVRQRFVPFVDGLIQQYGDTDEVILCVAHGGLYSMALPLVLVNVNYDLLTRYEFSHAVIIEVQMGAAGLVCISWNGVPI